MTFLNSFRSWILLKPLFLAVFGLAFVLACADVQSERLVRKADEEWIKGRNQNAIEILKSVLKKSSKGPFAEEALFRLGEIFHFSVADDNKAVDYFLETLRLNKSGKFAYPAQKYIAEIVESNFNNLDQAIIEYQKLIREFNRPASEKAEFQFHIASIYFKKQDYEQAIVELEVLRETYPKSELREEAQFKITEILYTLNRCDDVQTHYDAFKEEYPESRFHSEIAFVEASCLEESGKLKESLAAFKALKKDYSYKNLVAMKIKGIEKRMRKVK